MIDSPCKDCKRRKLGCHDSNKCKDWAEYVIACKKKREENMARKEERFQEKKDAMTHLKRHGVKLNKGRK